MSDWFSTAIAMQREMLRAQRSQIDAAEKMLGVGRQMVDLQAASQKAAEANVAAWKNWAKLWGWK